ncbi:MAG: hypothetical protein V4596_06210 [Bdellovibrionota bacterium]
MFMGDQSIFWPYDEVRMKGDTQDLNKFYLTCPWLSFQFKIESPLNLELRSVIKKLESEMIDQECFQVLNQVFSQISDYPVAYCLPRKENFGTDTHELQEKKLNLENPQKSFEDLFPHYKSFAQNQLPAEWSWDVEQTLEFTKTKGGYDPLSLFSVLRRFHLLNDLEFNETGKLFQHLTDLSNDPEKLKKSTALVLRQNHYVTTRCKEVLSAAIPIAQSVKKEIEEFIEAEAGHDRIIMKGLKTLNPNPENIAVLEASTVLMDLFKFIAQRNLLAFSAVVDVFERTSYREEDPLASILKKEGMHEASRMVDIHREINDKGDHENVALKFLSAMKPVSREYAIETLRVAELNTLVVHQNSKMILEAIKK